MDRKNLILLLVVLTAGCARAPIVRAVTPARDAASGGQQRDFAASPSPDATALLPPGAGYRVVLGSDSTLGLAIVAADRRILGRVAIAAGAGPHASPGVRMEIEDVGGQTMQIEAWSSAGALHGQAFVGARSVQWRVRYAKDGSLAGERWSLPHRDAVDELVALHRARVLAADLDVLATELSDACVLAERLALATLALELSVRAWAGYGRARLPTVSAIDDPCAL